jgi:hypothetical protein
MRIITNHSTATNDVGPSMMEKVRSRDDANPPSLFLPSFSLDASFSYHHWVVIES